MPLIIMVGIPCSGKTTQSKLIKDFLVESKGVKDVQIINEEMLGLSKT